jgi:hypothetical protein
MSQYLINSFSVAPAGFDLSELKAYWKFNESSGDILNSSSSDESLGSSANATVSGMTYNTSGSSPFGYEGEFDGTNDNLVVGSSTSIFNFCHNVNCKWSLNAWVQTDIVTVQQLFATMDDRSGTNRGMSAYVSQGSNGSSVGVGCGIYSGSSGVYPISFENTSALISDTNWHMLTYTYDQTITDDNFTWYLDGSEVGTADKNNNDNSNSNATSNAMIAWRDNGARYWNGALTEISLWNRILSSGDVSDLYNSGSGLEL